MSNNPQDQKADVWMVVYNADFSGTKVYMTKEEALKEARRYSREYDQQTGVYRCTFSGVAVPR